MWVQKSSDWCGVCSVAGSARLSLYRLSTTVMLTADGCVHCPVCGDESTRAVLRPAQEQSQEDQQFQSASILTWCRAELLDLLMWKKGNRSQHRKCVGHINQTEKQAEHGCTTDSSPLCSGPRGPSMPSPYVQTSHSGVTRESGEPRACFPEEWGPQACSTRISLGHLGNTFSGPARTCSIRN